MAASIRAGLNESAWHAHHVEIEAVLESKLPGDCIRKDTCTRVALGEKCDHQVEFEANQVLLNSPPLGVRIPLSGSFGDQVADAIRRCFSLKVELGLIPGSPPKHRRARDAHSNRTDDCPHRIALTVTSSVARVRPFVTDCVADWRSEDFRRLSAEALSFVFGSCGSVSKGRQEAASKTLWLAGCFSETGLTNSVVGRLFPEQNRLSGSHEREFHLRVILARRRLSEAKGAFGHPAVGKNGENGVFPSRLTRNWAERADNEFGIIW